MITFLFLCLPQTILDTPILDLTLTSAQPINSSRTEFYPSGFNCPCRRKTDKNYICWGVGCPITGTGPLLEEDAIAFESIPEDHEI